MPPSGGRAEHPRAGEAAWRGQTGLVHGPLHRLFAGLTQSPASLSLSWGWARGPAGLL